MATTRSYDSQFRLSLLQLKSGASTFSRRKLQYDAISWLDAVVEESPGGTTALHTFDYTFKPGTPILQSVQFRNGSTPVMTQTYNRDAFGRLDGVSAAKANGDPLRSVGYQLDLLDRRQQANWNDGTL